MFSFNKIKASDMGLRVLNNITLDSPNRNKNLIQIPGRNGSLVTDNNRYDDILRSIPCRLETGTGQDVETMAAKISSWLGVADYHEFLWHQDPDFIYSALVENGVATRRRLARLADILINFRIYPIKYLRSSMIERAVDNGRVLVNSLDLAANPLVRVVGTGLVILSIGTKTMEVNIPADAGGCLIDSETFTIKSLANDIPLFSNASGVFPTLAVGNNLVSWESANEIQVFVTPRLGALI